MTELFPIPQVLSPRLAWMKKHDLHTFCSGKPEDFLGEPWNCWQGNLTEAVENAESGERGGYCTGATEQDAIAAWAKANNVKLWNEE